MVKNVVDSAVVGQPIEKLADGSFRLHRVTFQRKANQSIHPGITALLDRANDLALTRGRRDAETARA